MVMGIAPQDIEFISDVYPSVVGGRGIEPAIARYTSYFPDIRFTWQAMACDRVEYFALEGFHYDDSALHDYMEVAHLNAIPAMAARMPLNAPVKSEFFLTTAEYEKTDIYNLFFRNHGKLNSSMGLWAYRDGADAAFLGIDVPAGYCPRDREMLDQSLAVILPHLQRAFELMFELDLKRKRIDDVNFWLETLPCAAFLMRANGVVLEANAVAQDLFSVSGCLSIGKDGRLSFASAEQRDSVEPYWRRAMLGLEPSGPFPIPCEGASRLSGYCLPLPVGEQHDAVLTFFKERRREVLMVVVDPLAEVPVTEDVVAATLGVTPAEARIVSALCQGGDLREAAEEVGIAHNTARAQVASATGKLGLRRQTELVKVAVQAVTAFPPMRGSPGAGARSRRN